MLVGQHAQARGGLLFTGKAERILVDLIQCLRRTRQIDLRERRFARYRLTSRGDVFAPTQDQQPRTSPVGFSGKTLGHVKPTFIKSEHPTPPFRYAWEDTLETLEALKESETEGDPANGLLLTYTHPLTGGPTLPTFACELQLLTAKQQTKSHRHLSTTVYQVFKGEGATVVDGQRLEWAQGDIFVIPPWAWHSHENRSDGDSILYSMNDWPALKALGLYREEGR